MMKLRKLVVLSAFLCSENNSGQEGRTSFIAALSPTAWRDSSLRNLATDLQSSRSQSHRKRRVETFSRQMNPDKRFIPRYEQYELPLDIMDTVKEASPHTLPSKQEKKLLSEKIARLLSEEIPSMIDGDGNEVADRATVHAPLSDDERDEATSAVSRTPKLDFLSFEENTNSRVRREGNQISKRRLKAQVSETGSDSITQYVKSMGKHHVLSAEDEAVLGRHIQRLVQWEEKRCVLEDSLLRPPTFAEWAETVNATVPELKHQIRRSQKAKTAMIAANLRLVVHVARSHVKKGRKDVSFVDACQEGVVGLNKAVERFDPERGFRFSSYATWWIKKMVHSSVTQQSRPIRLPNNAIRRINDIRIHERVLKDMKGRRPTDEELATRAGMTLKQLDFYRNAAQSIKSLDAGINHQRKGEGLENSMDLLSVVQDKSSLQGDSMDDISKAMMKEDIRRLLETLTPREQAVIRLRFGLDTQEGKATTIADIAAKFKTNAAMIQKIQARALTKLRDPYRNKQVEGYLDELV